MPPGSTEKYSGVLIDKGVLEETIAVGFCEKTIKQAVSAWSLTNVVLSCKNEVDADVEVIARAVVETNDGCLAA